MTNYLSGLSNYLCSSTENLIRNICKDLQKEEEVDNLISKYLSKDDNKNSIYIKKNKQVKNKRKKTAYSMFLKYNTIRKENLNMTLEEYNIYKGEYWKNISSEEKSKYRQYADEWNEKNKTTKQKKEENIDIEISNKKDKEVDLLDCFFDDEYLKDKKIERTIEEI